VHNSLYTTLTGFKFPIHAKFMRAFVGHFENTRRNRRILKRRMLLCDTLRENWS